MSNPNASQELALFHKHVDQLCDESGVDIDDDTRRMIFDASVANGFTPHATVASFIEIAPGPDDEYDDDDEDIDWSEHDDGPPDYDSMSQQEANDAMVARAKQLDPQDDDPDREYDIDNRDDFVDYAVAKLNGAEFDEHEVDVGGDAA